MISINASYYTMIAIVCIFSRSTTFDELSIIDNSFPANYEVAETGFHYLIITVRVVLIFLHNTVELVKPKARVFPRAILFQRLVHLQRYLWRDLIFASVKSQFRCHRESTSFVIGLRLYFPHMLDVRLSSCSTYFWHFP